MSRVEAVVTYSGRRLTPQGTRECWVYLKEGVDDLPRGTDLYSQATVDTLRAQLEAAEARAEAAKAECARLRRLLRETSAVGITMLFDSHADDVRAEFSSGELMEVVAISDPLNANGAQVEKVYRAAWNAARTKEQQA